MSRKRPESAPTRRSLLAGVAASLVAGCSGLSGDERRREPFDAPAQTTDSDTDTPPPTTADGVVGTVTGEPLPGTYVSAQDQDSEDHRLTLTIARDGNRLFRRTYDINDGPGYGTLLEGPQRVATRPDTYRVVAKLANGPRATYDWRVGGVFEGFSVIITPDGLDFRQSVECTPACDPVSTDGTAAALPYAIDGNEETFTNGSATIRNAGSREREVTLTLRQDSMTVLDYTYQLMPDRIIEVPALTATTGDFEVTLTTGDGARTEYEWSLPAEDNYPSLLAIVRDDAPPLVGCGLGGGASVTVQNLLDDTRTLSVRLERPREETLRTIADREVSVAGESEQTVEIEIPIGDEYRLTVESGGERARATIPFCSCYTGSPEVRVDEDGLELDSGVLICQ